MKRLTRQEWFDLGRQKFGDDLMKWIFVCPICGTEQKGNDLIKAGVQDDYIERYLGFSCIGRFNKSQIGCDWTLGGLFRIHKLEVILDNGTHRPIFEFASSSVENDMTKKLKKMGDQEDD